MNILWVAGEATNWAVGYCKELAELGNNILLIGNSEDLYDKNYLDAGKVNVQLLDFKDFNFINMTAIVNELGFVPDVIFGSHVNVTFNVYQVAQKLKKPWGMMVLDIPSDLMMQDRKRMRLWNAYFDVLKQANEVIFNTEVARDEFFKYTNNYTSNVITYAPNIPKEYIIKDINFEPDNYVVSICRLTKIKACHNIPLALSMLKDKPKYIAIGRDGGDLKDITVLCKELGIEFIHLEDVSDEKKYEIIYNAKAVIYPQESEYIGGLSPFEAMNVGTPAIVGDYKILRDLYKQHAYYFNNSVDMAHLIAFACNMDKKKEWNKSNLELARQYSLKNNYKSMAFYINEVLKNMV